MKTRSLALTWLVLVALNLGVVAGASCAHAPDPILTSGHVVKFAGKQYLETNKAVEALHARGAITEETWGAWLDFKARWKPAYALAVEAWVLAKDTKSAADEGGAMAALKRLADEELSVWFAMVMRVAHVDGGAP